MGCSDWLLLVAGELEPAKVTDRLACPEVEPVAAPRADVGAGVDQVTSGYPPAQPLRLRPTLVSQLGGRFLVSSRGAPFLRSHDKGLDLGL